MIYKNLFVDSDILQDQLLDRNPFSRFAEILIQLGKNGEINLHTSTLVMANIYYLITKNTNKHIAKEQLRTLTNIFKVLPFEVDALNMALNNEDPDLEDAIQFHIAQKNNCEAIISRNIKHYKKFSLPVLTAEQLLEIL